MKRFSVSQLLIRSCVLSSLIFHPLLIWAQENSSPIEGQKESNESSDPSEAQPSVASKDFVRSAWEASSQGDLERLGKIVEKVVGAYGAKAAEQKGQLSGFPARGEEHQYQAMNDVATILFVKAEALMNYGRKEESMALFKQIIETYPWAQAWDPRGWYWSVAEKSQSSIDVMTGKIVEPEEETSPERLKIFPKLYAPGKERVVDYTKYGKFLDVGQGTYHYEVSDPIGLGKVVGEGIYPNTGDVLRDPEFEKLKKEGRLNGSHWDFVNSDDLEAAFYKWATAPEPWGVKLFYIGLIFEKAGMYYEALKAYHALVVHFPGAVGWTYWKTPWYPAQAAVAKIKHIIRTHPELNLEVRLGMKIEINQGFDNDIANDLVVAYPGKIHQKNWIDQVNEFVSKVIPQKSELGKIVKTVGTGQVQLIQYQNGHWKLFVKGQPFVIKGITYAPTKIGQSPDNGTNIKWMYEDSDNNGLADGPFDSWVDANKNNFRDSDEPIVGDFKLMKDMGVNVIREYHQPVKPNKELLRKMHEQYGFYVVMGDFLGKYTLGSGASWFAGTDYENPVHKAQMMESVRTMIKEYKDEPYILMWVLGNENNYGIASNADKKPEAYFRFVNEVAKMIKAIDPDHPVAICNGDTLFLDKFAQYAPDVDILSANVYRGDYGFGAFWEQVMDATGKPAFITEYGCPAYARWLSKEEAEEAQANYHRGNWLDIKANMAGEGGGAGNALGGIVFEWTDEWWKNYEPFYHDRRSDAIGPFPGGYYYEEWFGITSQGNGTDSPFMRQLRKSYFAYKDMWNN